jgi:hypothetical protein
MSHSPFYPLSSVPISYVLLLFFCLSPHLTPVLTMSHSPFYSLYSVSIHFFCLALVILYHSPFHSHFSVSLPLFCLTPFLLSHSVSNSHTFVTLPVSPLFLCLSPHQTTILTMSHSPFYSLYSILIYFFCLTPFLLAHSPPHFCTFVSLFCFDPFLLLHSLSHSFLSYSLPVLLLLRIQRR